MRDAHYSHAGEPRGRGDPTAPGRRWLLLACAGIAAASGTRSARLAAATLFSGRVVHITDSATFTVATHDGRRVRVSLAGTTTPAARPAADRARRALAALLFKQPVEVRAEQWQGGPVRGRVLLAGVDVAMQMVAEGWLGADGSDPVLVSLEQQARAARRGQWADGRS